MIYTQIIEDNPTFARIPNELVYDTRFHTTSNGAAAKTLLLYLYAKPRDWTLNAKTICQELAWSANTLSRAVKAATDLGWMVSRYKVDYSQDLQGKAIFSTDAKWQVRIPNEAREIYGALQDSWTGSVDDAYIPPLETPVSHDSHSLAKVGPIPSKVGPIPSKVGPIPSKVGDYNQTLKTLETHKTIRPPDGDLDDFWIWTEQNSYTDTQELPF